MQANRPDNFDNTLRDASGRNEYKPSKKVWKGIASHFDRLERKRRIWQGGVFSAFILICTFTAFYYNNTSDLSITHNLANIKGREIFDDLLKPQTRNDISAHTTTNFIYKSNPSTLLDVNNNISDKLNTNYSFELLQSMKHFEMIQTPVLQNTIEPISYKPTAKLFPKLPKKHWQLGFSLGYLNNNPINYNTGINNLDINLLPLKTLQIGSSISYKMCSRWALSSGINIYKTGISYYYLGSNSTIAERKNVDIYASSFYVAEIPLSINYCGSIKKSWGLGYAIGIGAAAQYKLPSHSNDGGYHIMNYGRNINGLVLLNGKFTKDTKNLQFSAGTVFRHQILNTTPNSSYKLLQTTFELGIGFKL